MYRLLLLVIAAVALAGCLGETATEKAFDSSLDENLRGTWGGSTNSAVARVQFSPPNNYRLYVFDAASDCEALSSGVARSFNSELFLTRTDGEITSMACKEVAGVDSPDPYLGEEHPDSIPYGVNPDNFLILTGTNGNLLLVPVDFAWDSVPHGPTISY